MRQVLKRLRNGSDPYHKLASLAALISVALSPVQAAAQTLAPQSIPAVATSVPPINAMPNVRMTMPLASTPAPRVYSAAQLEDLYANATRRGASIDDKKALQRAVYAENEWSATTIDGAIGRDTRRRYARAMANAGGFSRLSLANAVTLVQPQDLGMPASECAQGGASFANALCFDVSRLNISDVQRYRAHVGRYHYGMDISMPIGTAITMPVDGFVMSAGRATGYGQQVTVGFRINDTTECGVLVGHVSDILVNTGQSVPAGTTIALSGNEGRSSGPHAHVEIVCTDDDGATLTAPNLAQLRANGGLGGQPRFTQASYSSVRNDRLPGFLSNLMRNARAAFARLAPQPSNDLVVTRVASNDTAINSGNVVAPALTRISFGGESNLVASSPLTLNSGGAARFNVVAPAPAESASLTELTAREEDVLPTSRSIRSSVVDRNNHAWRELGLRPH